MSSISRQQLVLMLNNVDVEGKSVLDIGTGKNSPYKVTKWVKGKPSRYVTMDIDEGLEPDIVCDLNDPISDDLIESTKGFDAVFCLEVLEHCYNPVRALNNVLNLTGKKLYLSTPFINPIHDNWDYLRMTDEWYEKVILKLRPDIKDLEITPREATEGLEELKSFYAKEGLRMSKTRLKQGDSYKLSHIGYFVEVTL